MTYRAIRKARKLAHDHVPIPAGLCVLQVRLAMEILEPTGDQDGDGDADAVDAWKRARDKHFLTGGAFAIPRGTVVLWRGGSNGNGHAAIATGFGRGLNSTVWSPGAPGDETHWCKRTVGDISQRWKLTLVGYSYDLNGHPCPDVQRG